MTRRKTPTGRLSTFRPRYQNIPIRSGEEPARLSDGVKAAILGTLPPHPALPDAPPLDAAIDLVVFDYSILEMRVAAVMAERDPPPPAPEARLPRRRQARVRSRGAGPVAAVGHRPAACGSTSPKAPILPFGGDKGAADE